MAMTEKMREQRRLIRKWVKALRSGKFQQTAGVLCSRRIGKGKEQMRHCCLGVLAEVSGIRRVTVREYCEFADYAYCFPERTETATLPVKWFGARTGLTEADMAHLVRMNDHLGNKFGEIAKAIEAMMERVKMEAQS